MKIHTKIVPMADGRLYFASVDEAGEDAATMRLPMFGSHLWRIDPETREWEHLLSVPEGLIALNGAGHSVFALGLFRHVLYRFDIADGTVARLEVGADGGHISRNFVVDPRGHAFVPRVVRSEADGPPRVTLVELDPQLAELGETESTDYHTTDMFSEHGITSYALTRSGTLYFNTSLGALYEIAATESGPSRVTRVGWFHPLGTCYAPSLFPIALLSSAPIPEIESRGNAPFRHAARPSHRDRSEPSVLRTARRTVRSHRLGHASCQVIRRRRRMAESATDVSRNHRAASRYPPATRSPCVTVMLVGDRSK